MNSNDSQSQPTKTITVLQERYNQQAQNRISKERVVINRNQDNYQISLNQEGYKRQLIGSIFIILLAIMGLFILPFLYIMQSDTIYYLGRWNKGIDSRGNLCGFQESEKYPYVYLSNQDNINLRVCVDQCPTKITTVMNCYMNKNQQQNCKQNINITNPEDSYFIYDTIVYMDSLCVPSNIQIFDDLKNSMNSTQINMIMNDIWTTKYLILGFMIAVLIFRQLVQFINYQVQSQLLTIYCLVSCIFGVSGIVFFQMYCHLSNLAPNKNQISTAEINLSAIKQLTNHANPIISLVLSIFFIITFYGLVYYLYSHFNIMLILEKGLNIVKQFKNQSKEQNRSLIVNCIKSIIFIYFYFISLNLLAPYNLINYEDPFLSISFKSDQFIVLSVFFIFICFVLQLVSEIQKYLAVKQLLKLNYSGIIDNQNDTKTKIDNLVTLLFYNFLLIIFYVIIFFYKYIYFTFQFYIRNYIINKNKFDYLLSNRFYVELSFNRMNLMQCLSICKISQQILRPIKYEEIQRFYELYSVLECTFYFFIFTSIVYVIIQIDFFQNCTYSIYPPLVLAAIIGYTFSRTYTIEIELTLYILSYVSEREIESEAKLAAMQRLIRDQLPEEIVKLRQFIEEF